ncbi:MAG: isopeptide-forming domain-containing fimbrial protein, partial [Anaerolineae bacterium]|nr:isopeptide-forming domain-containing fimbrial protein [Anaerolineae bacterium]
SPGSHTVSEAAGYKTSLNDYDASLACANKQGQPVASTDGRVTVNANDEITCTMTNTRRQPVSKLTITKSVQVTHFPVQPGEALMYTIEVANSGGDAFGVVVSDNLPVYINGADLNQTVDIPANKRVTFTIPATVADDVPAGLTITNTARFSHASGSGQAAIAITTADAAPPTKSVIYVSSERNGRINGLSFADEDILAYDPNTDTWSKYFDGSDVGLTGTDLVAFFLLDDGSILLSLDRPKSLPGLGWVDDSDIVRFIPTALGYHTAGRFEWYFDGSDVGLTRASEDIDSISFTPEGDLVISTIGPFAVPWIGGRDEDLIRFKATHLGENTSGVWERYFDGSDIGLRRFSEDIRGAWIDPTNNDIYLTTKGDFSVDGFSGDGADIFICHPELLGVRTRCTFSFYWDGSAHGFTGETIDAFAIAPPVGPTTVTEADLLEAGSLSTAVQDDPDQVDDPEEEDVTVDNADNEDDGDAVHDLDDISTGATDDSSTIYLPFILK